MKNLLYVLTLSLSLFLSGSLSAQGQLLDDQRPEILLGMHPNPADHTVTFELNLQHAGEVHISIINLTGRQIRSFNTNYGSGVRTVDIDLEDAREGIYLARIEVAGEHLTKRLIVRH